MSVRNTISLYISSYNQARYLPRAIESVLAQTRPPDQLLIIDDASTDGSRDIIEGYRRRHPRLIDAVINDRNIGIGAVRALAVERCFAHLVTYLDGDDLYDPDKLEAEERALREHPQAGYAYSNFAFIDPEGITTGLWHDDPAAPPPGGDLFDRVATFTLARGVCHRCEMVRRELLAREGSYRAGLNLYEDFDLKLRLARRHHAVAVARPTHRYRMHPDGLHRISYAAHFDALRAVYARNAGLIESLPAGRRSAVRAGVNTVLSRYAWRAIKQSAAGEIELKPTQVLRYARAGAMLQPRSVLIPKHPYRVARALARF